MGYVMVYRARKVHTTCNEIKVSLLIEMLDAKQVMYYW